MYGIANRRRGRAFWAMCAILALGLAQSAARADSKDPFDLANRTGPVGGTAKAQGDPFGTANKAQDPVAAPARVDKNVENPTTRKPAELIHFQVQATPAKARPGQLVTLTITGVVKDGYHTYPVTQRATDQQS